MLTAPAAVIARPEPEVTTWLQRTAINIADPALPDAPAQFTATVHFIADHQGGPDPQGVRAV
jgi:hypothetical protein